MNGSSPRNVPWLPVILVLLLLGFSLIRRAAAAVLEYSWWKEVGQVSTLFNIILYGMLPVALVAILAFLTLWMAHARGVKASGAGLGQIRHYGLISTLVLLGVGYIAAALLVDSWTAVLYFGGQQLPANATAWHDPVFNHPLSFYLFDLPFYEMAVRVVVGIAILTGLVWMFGYLFGTLWRQGARFTSGTIEVEDLQLGTGLARAFPRIAVGVFLLALASSRYLDRYSMLMTDHGFMVGIEYVDENFRLPLRMLSVAGCVAAAVLFWTRRWFWSLGAFLAPMILEVVVPALVHSIYVRPNEISIEKPYIERHIAATREAYGLNRRSRELEFRARIDLQVDPVKHKPLLDNVRLWDWRAFHDTVAQIQALRPYYVFADSDVDRYEIDGKLQQVMLTPRELDVNQLTPDARGRWMNPHFIYTHGYGVVLAEANRITPDGLPVLYIQDAPPEIRTDSLKLTRPEIYYGEQVHEPVFVRTGQPEFNYPSGSENVHTRYEGRGGFPISSFPMRLAAAIAYTDWNIVLTGFLTPESRMMIRRNVRSRLMNLAEFLHWDRDPYLVITKAGRLVWMIDGYTTSQAHPYSQMVGLQQVGAVNYMRNSVKATVDAYDGDVKLYIFDADDPVIQAYSRLFPDLLHPASEMPPDLREHARYPEVLFRVQAEIYRNFHMRNPEAFYNKEDAWDIAKYIASQQSGPAPVEPAYVVATLPGEEVPEFLLMIPFTPRNKDNLIGFMAARCDGGKLGELLFLQLSKQELVFGPMQIEARINQDQNISKDLSLWNQQGSQVLRGQMVVLPLEESFLYVEPIYIQASEARMPQLKKIALAVGNTLIYTDTWEQAVRQLGAVSPTAPRPEAVTAEGAPAAPPPAAPGSGVATNDEARQRLEEIRRRLQRYRELMSQGKFAEAGRELEALEAATRR